MKKFLEELNKSSRVYDDLPQDTEADRMYRKLAERYKRAIGRRALYTSKSNKEVRVITIEQVTLGFVSVSYSCYGRDYMTSIRTSVSYPSLICGDERLEIE